MQDPSGAEAYGKRLLELVPGGAGRKRLRAHMKAQEEAHMQAQEEAHAVAEVWNLDQLRSGSLL